MKKILGILGVSLVLSFPLTGCMQPTAHSIGASLMAAPLEHRADGHDLSSQLAVSASGFWGRTSEADNLRDLNAGGGILSLTYRLNGVASPFFINLAAGAFGGSLRFACTEEDCATQEDKVSYYRWLSTESGQASYAFGNTQERVLVGLDFNPGSFLIFGAAAGAQFYQGYSEYEDVRKVIGDLKLVNNVDYPYDYGLTTAYWIGLHIGSRGQYGNFVVEFDNFFKGSSKSWTYSTKYTYTHPRGYFGGLAEGSLMELTFYLGKTFVF